MATQNPETSERKYGMTNIEKMNKIQDILNNTIRPALRSDGGDLELIDVEGDRVIVKLQGACAGCPGAHMTLKRWVEAKLKELVSPELTVEEEMQR